MPIGRLVSGCSALYETHVGTVSIVWLDPRLLSFTLYSRSLIPGGGPYLRTAPISEADALNLVAAFNSGFKDGDSHGGYFAEGRAEVPLVDGIASAVIYTDGTMRIGTWGSEVSMTPDVVSVRQNMTLLIDNGVINPATSSEPYSSWGITWPGGPTTNRSALGVTAQGAELFAGGAGLTVPQITQAIASAGAVRAMELDENDIYPNFSIFTPALGAPASARNGTEVVPGFSGPKRYFTASWNRDFFAASARPPAPLTQHRQQRG
ncbi:MAG: phosphodiester glycosidase family protein [Streptosporangiaceae bacterium]